MCSFSLLPCRTLLWPCLCCVGVMPLRKIYSVRFMTATCVCIEVAMCRTELVCTSWHLVNVSAASHLRSVVQLTWSSTYPTHLLMMSRLHTTPAFCRMPCQVCPCVLLLMTSMSTSCDQTCSISESCIVQWRCSRHVLAARSRQTCACVCRFLIHVAAFLASLSVTETHVAARR